MSFGFGFSLPAVRFLVAGYNPFNQNGPTLDLSFIGTAPSVTNLSDPNGFTLDANFIVPQYQIAAEYVIWEDGMGLVSKTFSQIITFTRASTATFFNSSGVLTSASNDVARFDYNPSTLAAQGLLIEEARTNSIRNNTMVGAVAGTPGTVPTNWVVTGLATGIDREIVGVGTENGVTYIDVRFFGTATASSAHIVAFEAANQIAATSGQTWAASTYAKISGGSLTNVATVNILTQGRDAGNTTFTETFTTPFTPTATLTRFAAASALANASTAFVRTSISVTYLNGAAIDITLRIGLPQLELGAFATSVIPTTTTALTRAVDVASVNTLSPWFNSVAGTMYAEAVGVNNVAISTRRFAEFGEVTAQERSILGYNLSFNTRFLVQDNGVTQADVQVTTGVTAGSLVKMAAAYATNDFQQASNGTLGTADTSGTLPTPTTLYLGSDNVQTAATTLNGYLRRISYYPRRLSNAELQAITT